MTELNSSANSPLQPKTQKISYRFLVFLVLTLWSLVIVTASIAVWFWYQPQGIKNHWQRSADDHAVLQALAQDFHILSAVLESNSKSQADAADKAPEPIAMPYENQNYNNSNAEISSENTARMAQQLTQSNARLVELEQKLENLQNSLRRSKTHSQLAALWINVTQVRDALKQGKKFEMELMATQAFLPEDTTIQNFVQQLSPFAARGLPSLSSLKLQFLEIADSIVIMDRAAKENPTRFEQIWSWISKFIHVRRVSPEGSGTGTQVILARAEALLKDENLSAALSELKSLQGQAANAASPWIEDAEHVRHAHDIVDRLLAYVTQKMVQESGLVGEQQ